MAPMQSVQSNFIHTKTYQTMMRDLDSYLHKIMLIRRTWNAECLCATIVFQFTRELMDNIHCNDYSETPTRNSLCVAGRRSGAEAGS